LAKARRQRIALVATPMTGGLQSVASPLCPLRAAVAAGDRILIGLSHEWAQISLEQATWQRSLRGQEFDLLLIEVNDRGVPGWDENGDALNGLLRYARGPGTPVIAWVTGAPDDPDLAASWIDSVQAVFLADPAAVDPWRERWPNRKIGVLPPAAQPRIQNPAAGGPAMRRDEVAGLVVHDGADGYEALGALDPRMVDAWPADPDAAARVGASPLAGAMVDGAGLLPRPANWSRYRAVAELMGKNTGPSWTVVEAGSAQTAVVLPAEAANHLPPDLRQAVVSAEDAQTLRQELAALVLQGELRDREALPLARAVLARHTFRCRVQEIARVAGLDVAPHRRTVSAIVATNRLHQLDNALTCVASQTHAQASGLELVLVSHGLPVRAVEIDARARDRGIEHITVITADSSLPLGSCLNLGVAASGGEFIAKMDDDNFYGRHYLSDLLAVFDYTDAGIAGKWAHYVWLKSTDAVVLRFAGAEHTYQRLVQGGSMVLRSDVAHGLRFADLPRGVDTDILDRAKAAGVRTYSADRFNYVSIRGADRHEHTWTIGDSALMNRSGKVVFFGDPRSHVEV
jgi:Glycosyl transferase family 2